jgi:hypothetical protein
MKKLELNIKKAMTMAYITKEKDVVNNSEIIHDKCSEVFCTIGPKIERRIDVIEVSNDHTLNVLGSDWPVKHIAAMGSSEIFFKNFCPFNEKRQTTIFVDKDSTIKLYGEYMNISYCILGANSHFSWEVEGGGGGDLSLICQII